jgi:DNA-binding response OmpR family regulator
MKRSVRQHKPDSEARRTFVPGLASFLLMAVLLVELYAPTGRAGAAMLLSSGGSDQTPMAWSVTSLFSGEGILDRGPVAGTNGIADILERVLIGHSLHRFEAPALVVNNDVSHAPSASEPMPVHGTGPLIPMAPAPSSANLFLLGLTGVMGVLLRKQPLLKQDMGTSTSLCDPVSVYQSVLVQVISPDDRIPGLLSGHMSPRGYDVNSVSSADDLLSGEPCRVPALILADQRVSDWDMLRTDPRLKHVPILVVVPAGSAYTESDALADLERGADGVHLCADGKRLLAARIGAFLRRSGAQRSQRGVCHVGGVELDADLREVTIGGERIQLSAKPFALLETFMRAPSKLFSRRELIALLWGPDFAIGDHTLDVHIHALRQQLDHDPHRRCSLVTIKGVGFKLKVATPDLAPAASITRSMEKPAVETSVSRAPVAGWISRRKPSAVRVSRIQKACIKRRPLRAKRGATLRETPMRRLRGVAAIG